LDRTRTFLTLVVLFHHAVIPYTYFGHTDPKFFIGFDMVVIATDSFFMAMFFLLSGLFVWPGLVRKGPWRYLLDRLLRLGLPFAIGALTIIPIAYYALSLRHQPEVSFADFWWKTVTVGPWPSGPIWFLWVLFGLDVIASLLYVISPKALDPINRLSLRAREEPAKSRSGDVCRDRRALRSRTDLLRSGKLVRVRTVLRTAWPRAALRVLFHFRRGDRCSGPEWRSVGCRRQAGKRQLDLDPHCPHSILLHVGIGLHQARNPGKSDAIASLV
jgi:hypothetical protein